MSHQRLAFEVDQLAQRYPNVSIKLLDGELHVAGSLISAPGGIDAEPLQFDMICRPCFPACAPKVNVISPDLSHEPWGHKWHLWSEGNICFISPFQWDVAYSLADVLDKVSDWYYNYLAVKRGLATKMPDEGRVRL